VEDSLPLYPTGSGGNTPVPLLQPGVPGYAFGSKDLTFPTTVLQITNVALTSNIATVTVTVRRGKVPAAGSSISITGTAAASGTFNVSSVTISTVSINATTGVGTITFPLTHADVVSVADAGQGYVPIPEVPESLAVQKSQAFAIQSTIGRGYGLTWAYNCPSAPSTIAIQLEGAVNNNDSEFTLIGSSQTTTTGYNEIVAQVPNLINFVRLRVTATTGGSTPTLIGKIIQT
jgi:hypothetical protein